MKTKPRQYRIKGIPPHITSAMALGAFTGKIVKATRLSDSMHIIADEMDEHSECKAAVKLESMGLKLELVTEE